MNLRPRRARELIVTGAVFVLGLIAVASIFAGLYLLAATVFGDVAYESSAAEAREVGAVGVALILVPAAALGWAVLRQGRDKRN